ncbi:MAG: ankyrin repeat domain-containing protein [Gammaproteobacteria bacterium]
MRTSHLSAVLVACAALLPASVCLADAASVPSAAGDSTANVNVVDARPGPVPQLVRAAERGDRAAVEALLRAGGNAREADADGTTALHWAAHLGDADLTRILIRAGADVRASNQYSATPMSAAAEIGAADVLEALLKAGADAESPNAEGQTALMAVARTGKVDAARVLLKHRANANAREAWGNQTALMWAAAQSQPEMIRVLLQHGAQVDARAVTRDWQRRVTAEGRPKDMDRGGFTPLLYAAREGCVPCATELLARGADINLGDPDGVTPLTMALLNIHWDMARLLIERGADVNLWDLHGLTPLYAAVDMNTLPKGRRIELPALDETTGLQIIQMLLDRHANANAQLKLRLPWRQVPYDRYTEPLLNIGVTPLIRAAKAGDIPVVKLLLEHGALANLPNFNGDTPLMAAVGKGWINSPSRGAFYTEEEALEVYALLRAAGADVNARTHFNETALHSAALRGWNEIVKKLIADGAELDVKDGNGLTAIDFALGRIPKGFNERQPEIHTDTVALLKTAGAKVENPDAKFPAVSTPRIHAWIPNETALVPPQ